MRVAAAGSARGAWMGAYARGGAAPSVAGGERDVHTDDSIRRTPRNPARRVHDSAW